MKYASCYKAIFHFSSLYNIHYTSKDVSKPSHIQEIIGAKTLYSFLVMSAYSKHKSVNFTKGNTFFRQQNG